MNRKKLIVLIAAVTVVTAPSTVTVWADNTTTSETANGYIESELDNNTPLYEPDESLYMSVPTAYPENGIADIRADYPANRDQNPYGTCWAFSSTGLAEFDMINDGLADKDTVDFSEAQLAYFAYNFVTDPLGGTEGDKAKYNNKLASTIYQNRGGNFEYALRRYSQWIGLVNESDVPYSIFKNDTNASIDSKYAYGYDRAHLLHRNDPSLNEVAQAESGRCTSTAAVKLLAVDGPSRVVRGDDAPRRGMLAVVRPRSQYLVVDSFGKCLYSLFLCLFGQPVLVGLHVFFLSHLQMILA